MERSKHEILRSYRMEVKAGIQKDLNPNNSPFFWFKEKFAGVKHSLEHSLLVVNSATLKPEEKDYPRVISENIKVLDDLITQLSEMESRFRNLSLDFWNPDPEHVEARAIEHKGSVEERMARRQGGKILREDNRVMGVRRPR
jgi:hypothetical protein